MIKNYPKKLERSENPFYTLDNESSFSQGYAYNHTRFPVPMHSHNYYELNIVIQGECIHYFNNKSHPAKIGDVFMIPPYFEHGYWTNEKNAKIFHLIIKNHILKDYDNQLSAYSGIKILFEIEPQIRQAFSSMSLNINLCKGELAEISTDLNELIAIDDKKENDGVLFDLKSVCLLIKLAKLTAKKYAEGSKTDDKAADYVILKTTQYMEENYASKITVDDLSKIVNMSTPTYYRYFKKVFNTSPMEYLKKIRISHATSMLSSTDKSISFIAQECGFFDSSHFTHAFEQATNMTPKVFRRHSKTNK